MISDGSSIRNSEYRAFYVVIFMSSDIERGKVVGVLSYYQSRSIAVGPWIYVYSAQFSIPIFYSAEF